MSDRPRLDSDATASLLGYLYQIDVALATFLEERFTERDLVLSIEILDDISFESDSGAVTLTQVKYKVNDSAVSLRDTSRDIWRTIELWLSEFKPGDGIKRVLLTNGEAFKRSAMSLLRVDDRDVDGALNLLDIAAAESTNKKTAAARAAWTGESKSDRFALLSTITVVDNAGDFEALNQAIDNSLAWAAPSSAPVAFRKGILAAWHSIALDILLRRRRGLRQSELRLIMSDLRDSFSASNLPTTVTEADVRDVEDVAALVETELYVDQLRWIKSPTSQFEQAVLDYCRVVRQRANWIDDNILAYLDIQEYEDRLRREWRSVRDWHLVDLAEDTTENERVALGRALFRQLFSNLQIRIRETYSDPFFMRGIYHQLASDRRDPIGWHPDYVDRIALLLQTKDSR